MTCHVPLVYGAVQDYQAVTEADKEDNKIFQAFSTEDGSGNSVNVAAIQDTVYVAAKNAGIYSKPGESSEKMGDVALGDTLERSAVCDNGWSKVSCEVNESKVIGYIQNQMLSDTDQIQPADKDVEVKSDATVLDYPSRKDGEEVGEVLQLDEVKQTGTVNGVWSRITYQNDDGTEAEGYIPTSCLDLPDAVTEEADTIDKDKDAGTLHESSGEGVFADALEDVDPGVSVENGVQIGTPVAASSDANLQDLGVFKITTLLSVQYLLRTIFQWNYIDWRNGNYQSYDCSRSICDSVWKQSSDQRTGLCCRGLWWCNQEKIVSIFMLQRMLRARLKVHMIQKYI